MAIEHRAPALHHKLAAPLANDDGDGDDDDAGRDEQHVVEFELPECVL